MKIHVTNLYGMAANSTVILAQNTVQKTAQQLGFKEIGFYYYNVASDTPSERNKRLDGIMSSVSFGDIVIFQSPTWNGDEFDREFLNKLKDLHVKIIIFLHDVGPLMFPSNAYLMPAYIDMYNLADVIIVPSEKMKHKLLECGLTVQHILIQHMWDHPHNVDLHAPQLKKMLYFAGDLSRFPSLSKWQYTTPLHIFSNNIPTEQSDNVVVSGWKNDSELLSVLSKGGFGLVWGTTDNEGESDEYYQMNVSHKVSTYLAAGIPVIVPKDLSCAHIITQQKLGYVVGSLEEANQIVNDITEADYQELVNNVKQFSFLLKEGYFTKKLLIDAVYQLAWN